MTLTAASPYLGVSIAASEASTGKNFFDNNKELSTKDRVLSGVSVGLSAVSTVAKVFTGLKSATHVDDVARVTTQAEEMVIFANNIGADELLESAMKLQGKQNTAIGRAFQKHTLRDGTAFIGEKTGNPAKNTEQGLKYLNDILSNPNTTSQIRYTKAFGDVLDVRLPDGMGARWSADGSTFIGFLEKYSK